MKVSDLKRQLMLQVDLNDQMEVEKVERYIDLIKLYLKMNSSITKHGAMIEIENGSQKYMKPNPAIAEKVKLSRAIIALGKDLNLDVLNKTITSTEEDYSEDDLV
ncbi:P27 family phage terminase small subunit [Vagococcus sp. BWB3-3]|uniref:P27 family phage terminase small subunit n=1 Tax=Vagococcus allomyrinae TaxID=2794353 RepID=A0A940SXR5_9ENTE|nr:P27 family phage terminase small subunit [Vagococcus allomyrinae]MBP1044399.1 P27 family phage terminase small subunit [Vagococcus allomyrinae]